MELKVWVEGVVRVVCGLSIDTSCQDVVIALAQATGQTGRYILALKLRGSERQLVADERPLQCLSQLGQLATEVQFILRRTGPSLGVGQEDTPTTERRLHRPPEPGPLKHRKPHKSLTFNLGPSAFSHGSQPNKARAASPTPVRTEELQELERRLRENEAELVHTARWEAELQAETDREQGTSSNLSHVSHRLSSYTSENVNAAVNRFAQTSAPDALVGGRSQPRDGGAASPFCSSGARRTTGGPQTELEGSGPAAAGDPEAPEAGAPTPPLIEELNKELRQCNLQQFIQQTVGPHGDHAAPPPATELYLSVAGVVDRTWTGRKT
uniref:Ras-associating domain-containing protein n=1 Tax=Scophthalmus maximus TaxID=52904 RepID=A0A8D3E258_SCOMX